MTRESEMWPILCAMSKVFSSTPFTTAATSSSDPAVSGPAKAALASLAGIIQWGLPLIPLDKGVPLGRIGAPRRLPDVYHRDPVTGVYEGSNQK